MVALTRGFNMFQCVTSVTNWRWYSHFDILGTRWPWMTLEVTGGDTTIRSWALWLVSAIKESLRHEEKSIAYYWLPIWIVIRR